MRIGGESNLVITHTTYDQARAGNAQSDSSNLQQVSKVSLPLANSSTSLNTLATTSAADLKQIKAAKLSLNDKAAIDQIKTTLIADAALANFPYTQDIGELKGATAKDWGTGFGDLLQLQNVGLGQKNIGENGIVTKSGLTAYLFTNETTKEARVVFGGTTSGEKAGGIGARSTGNFVTTAKQWLANIKNVFSRTPDSYKEAAQLVGSLKNKLPNDYKLSVSGHSKGGGESAYAAMMLAAKTGEPVKSINFSSAELGSKLKQNIANELSKNGVKAEELTSKFEELSKDILHVKIKGDPVPNVHKFFGNISHVGKTLTLPNDNKSALHLSEHIDFFSRIASWAELGSMKHHEVINQPRIYA